MHVLAVVKVFCVMQIQQGAACRNGGDNHIPDVQLILAEYIDQVLSWQGLGCALPHYAVVGNMIPLAKGQKCVSFVLTPHFLCKIYLLLFYATLALQLF